MITPEHDRLRRTFGEDPELYHRRRPGYPRAMYADLAVGKGTRVLEIGCGTGQATVALARSGCVVVAVELSPEMAAHATRNLAEFPDTLVVTAPFEDWPLPDGRFDLVFSATAFHWVDPDIRVAKSADALRPGGRLAVVSTFHIAGGSDAFFAEAQTCYERWDPSTPQGLRLLTSAGIPTDSTEIDVSGRFGPVAFHRYEWDQTYTTDEYTDLLLTYSNHRALPETARHGLIDDIADLADTRHGGRVTKRYLTQLAVAEVSPR
ncbi:class I SAM-dependent methyltransferase [Actinokineospora inagensis]|uniref:class I SAM-dependent methyltransferase n=1 Tax=Actinokineospora inagensis TaxID=103730 RepID=UPI00040E1FFE|nr:class I SAM-dependent methyltransferase [Actinokineospora inagensis]